METENAGDPPRQPVLHQCHRASVAGSGGGRAELGREGYQPPRWAPLEEPATKSRQHPWPSGDSRADLGVISEAPRKPRAREVLVCLPPLPRSPAVPGEGAEEPDSRSQRGPHFARPVPKAESTEEATELGACPRRDWLSAGFKCPAGRPALTPRLEYGSARPLAPDRPRGWVQRKLAGHP